MKDTLVKVDSISKKFCKSLKLSMIYGMSDIARNILGQSSKSSKLRKNEFWAVDNVSFELKRGETLGIIGPNGSGKSTILKMLNGIFWPDKGKIKVKGRVGALIEVGAGFHPMLTGRENIYLNGALLGMNKEEISKKFDQIVEFADIGDFLDTPVKNYSSGMYVRLGFSIAVHCEPDILLIDEILAVGDIGFRAKCYNMISLLKENTATIFVSHLMHMVTRIASKCLVINKSKKLFYGLNETAINKYYSLFDQIPGKLRTGSGEVQVLSVLFREEMIKENIKINYGDSFDLIITIKSKRKESSLIINLVFRDVNDIMVAECSNFVNSQTIKIFSNDVRTICVSIPHMTLNPGKYKMALLLMSDNMMKHYDWHRNLTNLEVTGSNRSTAAQQFIANWKVIK